MKWRVRVSTTRLVDADNEAAAREAALDIARGSGMDPEVEILGPVDHSSIDVHSIGQSTGSKMR